jgi:hypothetical protein
MTFVDNSVEKEIVDSSSNYQAGDIAENFQYTVTEKVKVVYFSEEESKNKIKENLNKEAQEGMKIKEIVEIEYLKDIVDFDKKRMELTIRAEGLFQSDINEEQIKKDLHKAGSEKIKEYLSGLEEIDRAVISYDPSWMSGFSVRSENILIKEESGE